MMTATAAQGMSMRMTLFLGLLLCCIMNVNAGRMMGLTHSNRYSHNYAVRGSRRSLQMDQAGCPKTYSLKHCVDPSINYEIPCDWNTCKWDLTALDPKTPPTSCIGISIDDPQTVGLADVVRPCALWSLMYGIHQTETPTLSCTLHSFVACACKRWSRH